METFVQTSNERRRFTRHAINADVGVTICFTDGDEQQYKGRLINISREGMAVILPSDIVPGTKVALTIYSNDDPSVCSGEVMWNKEHRALVLHGVRIARWSYIDPVIAAHFKTIKP